MLKKLIESIKLFFRGEIKCPYCGNIEKKPANFCGHCGKKLSKKKCMYCWKKEGHRVITKSKCCDECHCK